MTLLLSFPLALVQAVALAPNGGRPDISPASSYEQRYRELMSLEPRPDRIAPVSGLVISRDVAQFRLVEGSLYWLSSVGGRTVGIAFRGHGTFSFSPPTAIEQERLARLEKARSLTTPFTDLVLLFADTTLAELERQVTFRPSQVPEDVRAAVRTSLEYLGDADQGTFDPDLMAAFLNGESSDLFYAHMNRAGDPPLMFMLNPFEFEAVSLATRAPRRAFTRRPEVICQFKRQGAPAAVPATGERLGTVTIRDYKIDVTLAQSAMAGLNFAASARIEVTTTSPAGPWIVLDLFPKLVVDSVRLDDGTPLTAYRGKEAAHLWLLLERRLEPGATRAIVVYYHGDLIERYGDFFFIESSIAWYPRSLEGRSYATFDITYHSPRHYLLASVGHRKDSTVEGRVLTTRWVSPMPIRNASFNLGLFEAHQVREPALPSVTVLVSNRERRGEKERVADDLLQSLKFFQHVYGPPSAERLHAAEVPYFHGEAFPGLVNLSWVTFLGTDHQGNDEVFRAHEVAHQWWGIGVDFATYHDQWLSEGFSSFSGLWYLHAARRDSEKYFAMLRRWRLNILDKRDEPSPIWLGYRTTSSKDAGFHVLVYEKGAWVLHMLRILMLDLRTAKDDRFTAMMQDFYTTYRGRRASTSDFQAVVERHIGTDMNWFFNQWVYGTAIPSYRVAHKAEAVDQGQYRVTLRVGQENVPDDFQMYVPVTVDLGGGRQGRFRVNVRGPESVIVLPLLPGEPQGVKFNELEGVLAEVKMVGW